jgi:hypothetical protein
MSSISQAITVTNRTTGVIIPKTTVYNSNEASFVVDGQTVTTSPVAVDIGTIQTPKAYFFVLESGSDLLISLDGGSNYPLRLSGNNDMQMFRVDFESYREISQVVAEADISGSLGGDYIDMYDVDGLVRIWFDVDNGSSAPAAGGGRLVEVDIATDDTADTIASAFVSAFTNDANLDVTATSATITITDKYTGTRTNIADGATGTGWASITTSQEGAAAPSVYIKSEGTSEIVLSVIPN